MLQGSLCLVGNSSSGIKECSYLGVPVVNIGSRQDGRMRTKNVVDTGYDKNAIKRAIEHQVKRKKYKPSNVYFQKDTSEKIASTLASVKLYTQKQFKD